MEEKCFWEFLLDENDCLFQNFPKQLKIYKVAKNLTIFASE